MFCMGGSNGFLLAFFLQLYMYVWLKRLGFRWDRRTIVVNSIPRNEMYVIIFHVSSPLSERGGFFSPLFLLGVGVFGHGD